MAHNLLELLKQVLPAGLTSARPKTLRYRLFHMAARLVRTGRQWVLRLSSVSPLA